MNPSSKIADAINARRRKEVLDIYSNYAWFKPILEARKDEKFKKGGKAMRKVATIPFEVDHFFCRVYGEDYYKDPDFFVKLHSEWSVNKTKREIDPEDSAKLVRQAFEKQVYEKDINSSKA
jgi:hypothetical protein